MPWTSGTDFGRDLPRDRQPFGRRAPVRFCAAHPFDDRVGDAHSRQLVGQEFGVTQALERRNRRQHRNAEGLDRLQKLRELIGDRTPAA